MVTHSALQLGLDTIPLCCGWQPSDSCITHAASYINYYTLFPSHFSSITLRRLGGSFVSFSSMFIIFACLKIKQSTLVKLIRFFPPAFLSVSLETRLVDNYDHSVNDLSHFIPVHHYHTVVSVQE